MENEQGRLNVRLQLKPGQDRTEELQKRFASCLAKQLPAGFALELYPFASFPAPAEPNYQRKFRYI